MIRRGRLAGVFVLLAAVGAATVHGAAPPPYTPDQAKMLAIRAAQMDGFNRLIDIILAARISQGKTVGQALGPGGDGEIALRVYLRSARFAGEPRVYSDGVVEVDVEVAVDPVVREVARLSPIGPGETAGLEDLKHQAVDGYLVTSGRGRPPRDVPVEVLKRLESVRFDELAEMYPAGWEGVTASGRVEALGAARVRAHRAMADLVRGIVLGQTDTVSNLLAGSPAAEATLEAFIRSLPLVGEPRLMPDRIAEVEVAAPVRDLIRVLKSIRMLRGPEARWTDEEVDQLSVSLKTDRLVVTGRGMPPPASVSAGETAAAGATPLPDWAAEVFEARGTARFNDEVESKEEARLLAARSAKARALLVLEKQVDAIVLEDGRTVRQRAAKDEVFRRDLKMFLTSARTGVYRPAEDGKGWEVVLRLPLVRLYEFSRPRE